MSLTKEVPDENVSFDMIRDFVTLCRSGDYLTLAHILRVMRSKYQGLSDEEILLIVRPAIVAMKRGYE